jgi:hypothetical protein
MIRLPAGSDSTPILATAYRLGMTAANQAAAVTRHGRWSDMVEGREEFAATLIAPV